jgi:hypothetical protein
MPDLAISLSGPAGTTDNITNASTATGATLTDALDELDDDVTANTAAIALNTAKIGAPAILAHGTQGAVASDLADAVNEAFAASARSAYHGFWRTVYGTNGFTPNNTAGTNAVGAGSASVRLIADSTYLERRARYGSVSAAPAGSVGGVRWLGGGSQPMFSRNGGYQLLLRFGLSAVSATMRWFAGAVGSSSAPADVSPASVGNTVGIGTDGNANVQLYVNDASGSATPVDLGANFPALTVGASYEFWAGAEAGSSAMHWRCRRLDVAQIASGMLTSDLPTASAFCCPSIWFSNNTDASSVGIDVMGLDFFVPY